MFMHEKTCDPSIQSFKRVANQSFLLTKLDIMLGKNKRNKDPKSDFLGLRKFNSGTSMVIKVSYVTLPSVNLEKLKSSVRRNVSACLRLRRYKKEYLKQVIVHLM